MHHNSASSKWLDRLRCITLNYCVFFCALLFDNFVFCLHSCLFLSTQCVQVKKSTTTTKSLCLCATFRRMLMVVVVPSFIRSINPGDLCDDYTSFFFFSSSSSLSFVSLASGCAEMELITARVRSLCVCQDLHRRCVFSSVVVCTIAFLCHRSNKTDLFCFL